MKFLVSVIDSQTRSPHTPQEIQAIDDFNDKLSAHGQRIFAGGLDSPASAIVFDNRNGAAKSSEGPFISSDEFFSGFWIIEAESLEIAKELAAPACRALINAKLFKVSDLSKISLKDLTNLHGMGKTGIARIEIAMRKEGVSLH